MIKLVRLTEVETKYKQVRVEGEVTTSVRVLEVVGLVYVDANKILYVKDVKLADSRASRLVFGETGGESGGLVCLDVQEPLDFVIDKITECL